MIKRGLGGGNVLPFAPGWPVPNNPKTVQQLNLAIYLPLVYGSYGWWGSEANSEYFDTTWAASNVSHMTPNGTIGLDNSGTGEGVSFDGSTGYLLSPTSNIPQGSASRTLCAWMQTPSVSARRALISYGSVAAGSLWECFISAGNADVAGTTAGNVVWGSATIHSWSAGVIPTNAPVHIAMSSGANSSGIQIWINGVSQSISNDGTVAINTNSGQFAIDARTSGAPIWGSEGVWDWRMYSRILSTADVMDIYLAGLSGGAVFAPSQSLEMPVLKSTATFQAKWPPFNLKAA